MKPLLTPLFRKQRSENLKQRWAWGVSKDELFLPGLLSLSGYRSTLIGKWHLGYDRKFHPMNQGFDEFRGFIGGAVDYHSFTHLCRVAWQQRKKRPQKFIGK